MRTLMVLFLLAGCASTTPMSYEQQAATSRQALARAGLVRKAFGNSVYWVTPGRLSTNSNSTIVLLHGVNEQAGTWAEAAKLLAREYRLIIPDLAGHGESAPQSGPITYAQMLADLRALIDHEVPAGKVTIAGNSMGGWMAMLYAFDHLARVERLVLEDASGMAWRLDVPLAAKSREDAVRILRAVHGPSADTSDAAVDALLARRNTPMSRIDIADALGYLVDKRLPELTMPVTLIWGRHDGLLPLAYAEALQKRIPGSRLVVIEEAAHIPHRQQPRKFVACLTGTC